MRVLVEGQRGLHVERHGDDGGVPVVLVHGGAMDRRNWDDVVPTLVAAGHAVITLDLRACGWSDQDFVSMDVPTLGADVVRIMDALDIDNSVVAGWSVGGAVAVATAHQLGSRLDRLVVIGGATPRLLEDLDYPGLSRAMFEGTQQALEDDRAGFWRGMSAILFHRARPDLAEHCWQLFMSSGFRFNETIASFADLDQRPLLPDITAPVLVCHGRHDQFVPLSSGEWLAAHLPNARLVVFEDSGHAPFLEEPRAFRAALLAFLDGAAKV